MKNVTTLFKNACLIALAFVSFTSIAQEEETSTLDKVLENVTLSGSIDGYYRYNMTSRNDGTAGSVPATSFAGQSGFALGMANIILGYEGEKVGFVADLVFGPKGEDAVFNSDGTAQVINQLYAYWNVSNSVKLTMGNFNTFLGYEVISPTGNFNYSTSYMFSYGPFSHTGLKADFTINDKWSAMVAVMNPTDYTENNPFDTYIIGAQVGYANDNGSAYLNFRYGNEGATADVEPTFQVDLTTGWDVSDAFYLGVNATYLTTDSTVDGGDASGFYGVALYPQIKTSEKFTIGLRGEYFAEFAGGAGAIGGYDVDGDANVFATTLTGSYNVAGGLTLKPELRYDAASEDVFVDTDGVVGESGVASFLLGAIYKF